jgi:hemoglobin/transferrin/lactoferrin receptor protein
MEADSYTAPSTVTFPVTMFDLELPKRDRRKIGIFYDATDLTPWLKKAHFDAYYQTIDRVFKQDFAMRLPPFFTSTMTLNSESDDKAVTKGATVQFDTMPLPNHEFIFGGQFLDDNLDVVKTSTTTITPIPGFPITTVNTDEANIKTWSLFAQDEWSLGNAFKLTGGLRYYHVGAALKKSNHALLSKTSDDRIVGSLGLTYSGIENTTLRMLSSQGYVYPTLLQMFVDTPFGGGGITFGNPNLKPETSNNFEIGGRYRGGGFVFDAAAFYTQAEDYIARQVTAAPNGTWMNVNKATTYGAELFAEYNSGVMGNLTPYVNATWTRRKFEAATYSTYHTMTPAFTGRAGVKFDWSLNDMVGGWGDVYMRGASKTKLADATGITDTAKGWTTLNLAMGIDVGPEKNVQFVLNFNNVTNKKYTPANEIPGAGRSVELTTRIKF